MSRVARRMSRVARRTSHVACRASHVARGNALSKKIYCKQSAIGRQRKRGRRGHFLQPKIFAVKNLQIQPGVDVMITIFGDFHRFSPNFGDFRQFSAIFGNFRRTKWSFS
jgi:hypothetical protein